ncbi:hypothetical protein KHQ06_16630 [Nocardia tengchongensis]|uniref:Thioesterase TesA-like domain-containing protein n=1 Tax=Nocardia tengchongensis TaxID=2055889 RepID=A0ABX8D030_9NOCA|nr:alpha/beta fold hydrolase [Nocardia tengchongensis]QVI24931.1 hypothetical protein KHQ06_16630 [Nocardia tengchongensis]
MRLIVSIEQRFGVALAVSALAANPTAGTLALLLDGCAGLPADPLVLLRAGSGTPLFLVHPIGGNVLCYVELSKHLPEGQTLYGLQAAGLEPGSTPAETIPEMARDYVAAIQRVQPNGPYHLGGWSLGGMVAFEMAQQLTDAGHEVGMLAMIDAMTIEPGDSRLASERELYRFFLWELLLPARHTDTTMIEIPEQSVGDDEILDFILAATIEAGVLPATGSRELVRRLFGVFMGCSRGIDSYQPRRYPGDLTLLRCIEPLPPVLRPVHDRVRALYHDATNGWAAYAGGNLEVIDVPGDHLTVVESPQASEVAIQLTRLLDRAGTKVAVRQGIS